MKFKCPSCKRTFDRDLRLKTTKIFLNKKGWYKSWCEKSMGNVYMKPIQNKMEG